MPPITIQRLEDNIVRISLSSGRGNPLTPDLLDALCMTLEELTAEPPRALILDGGGASIFSGGFPLPLIAGWDRPAIASFFSRFLEALYLLMALPCPTVCGLNGHAIAGGFILSMGCDLRVCREEGLKFGLSEVDLGIAVPAGTQVLLAARTTPQAALKLSMMGKLMRPDEALQTGYADELAEDAEAFALGLAQTLAKKPGVGASVTRQLYTAPLLAAVKKADDENMDAFLDTWFSPVGQKYLKMMAAKLSRKR
ncbi:MAG: enoyl-CoA hydratase/carnithine racemase [Myxococcota bacterium]|jgi:enoyl-CoA hydratase/carnithine racemase